jgi:hypothetical protein
MVKKPDAKGLRHTFSTRLHQKGVPPFTIKDLAGHKSLNTTMRYIRIENKEQAEAVDRLEFGVSFEGKGASPLQPHRYLTIQKPGERAKN